MDDSCKIKLSNNIDRIIDAISLGKDLFPPSNLRNPCSVCNRNCLSHQAYLFCTNCKKCCHRLCDGTTLEQYNQLKLAEAESSRDWYCLYCTLVFNHENVPFSICSISELIKINSSDSMDFCNYLPSLEIIHESATIAKYSLPDPDFDLPNLVDSSYHTVQEFQNLDIIQNFNIFHANANGLEGKFDILHTFLASSKAIMDVIAVTETSKF